MNVDFTMGRIGDEPRVRPFVSAYERDMARRKLVNEWPNSDDFHAGVIFVDDEPMTAVFYAPLASKWQVVYCSGAYTRPTWRRMGFYSILMNIMVNEWRKEDRYDWFLSGYSKANWVSREVQKKQGREEYEDHTNAVRTRLSLRPTGNEFDLFPELLKPILDKVELLSS